jgi:hypothetical protein
VNGCALDVEGERRIKKCLEAAIERRYSEVNLILCGSVTWKQTLVFLECLKASYL